MKTAGILAMTPAGLMGRGQDLPWRWPEDLRHFQRTTRDHVVVMGRRTFESLCEQFGGPLKRRTNVVVSRSAGRDGEQRDGARWFGSLQGALDWAASQVGDDDEVFLLGGAELFRLALDDERTRPERMVVTWVPEVPDEPGDTFFPFRPPGPWIERHYEAARRWRGETEPLEFVDYRLR